MNHVRQFVVAYLVPTGFNNAEEINQITEDVRTEILNYYAQPPVDYEEEVEVDIEQDKKNREREMLVGIIVNHSVYPGWIDVGASGIIDGIEEQARDSSLPKELLEAYQADQRFILHELDPYFTEPGLARLIREY